MKIFKIIIISFVLFLGTNITSASNLEIELNGDKEVTIIKNKKYQESGVVVRGNNIEKVETTGTVNENIVGTYTITYTATDKSGDITKETRIVKVVEQLSPSSENYIPERTEPILEANTGVVLGVEKYNFSQKLSFGLKNTEVTELHKKLIIDGYLKIASPTGYFGSQTLKAVKDFQTANGLVSDGIVGPKTREALNK